MYILIALIQDARIYLYARVRIWAICDITNPKS